MLYRKETFKTVIDTIAAKIGSRPLLIPACTLIVMEEVFFRISTGSIILKTAVIAPVIVIFLLTAAIVFRSSRVAAGSVISAVILMLLCAEVTCDRLDKSVYEGDYREITGIVVSSKCKLDGTSELMIDTDGSGRALYRCSTGTVMDPGTRISIWGKLTLPDPSYNPGQFNYREYLRRRGITCLIDGAVEDIRVTGDTGITGRISGMINDRCFRMRRYVLDKMTAEDDSYVRGVAAALFMGDKSLLDNGLESDFRKVGCSHLIAVSGTHFAGFLMAMPALFALLGWDRRKSFPVYVVCCLAVGFFTGWSESVTRAAVMSICAFVMRDVYSGMSMATLVMGLTDPFIVLGNAFRMSFAAGLAIATLAEPVSRITGRLIHDRTINGIVAVYMAARTGILPFSSDGGMIILPSAITAQLAGGLLAQISCCMFVPAALIACIIPPAGNILSAPAMIPATMICRLVSSAASGIDVSSDIIRLPHGMYLIVTSAVVIILMPRSLIRRALAVILAVSTALYWGDLIVDMTDQPVAQVIFIDVGQGDACLIISGGRSCLIDTGTPEAARSVLIPVLDHYGIDTPDMVMISHWDNDHAGGMAELIKDGRCNAFLTAYNGIDDQTLLFLEEQFGINDPQDAEGFMDEYTILVSSGDSVALGDDVRIDIIYPDDPSDGENHSSIVAEADISGTKILFTGDIDTETEMTLDTNGLLNDIDILKVAHHGSAYSTCSEFICATDPELAVISAGRNNRYGHPAPETVERLSRAGTDIMCTAESGAVTLKIYDNGYVVRGYV